MFVSVCHTLTVELTRLFRKRSWLAGSSCGAIASQTKSQTHAEADWGRSGGDGIDFLQEMGVSFDMACKSLVDA